MDISEDGTQIRKILTSDSAKAAFDLVAQTGARWWYMSDDIIEKHYVSADVQFVKNDRPGIIELNGEGHESIDTAMIAFKDAVVREAKDAVVIANMYREDEVKSILNPQTGTFTRLSTLTS